MTFNHEAFQKLRRPGTIMVHDEVEYLLSHYPLMEAISRISYFIEVRTRESQIGTKKDDGFAQREAKYSYTAMIDLEDEIMRQWNFGNLTKLGVANALVKAGFNSRYATEKANTLTEKLPPLLTVVINNAKKTADAVDAFAKAVGHQNIPQDAVAPYWDMYDQAGFLNVVIVQYEQTSANKKVGHPSVGKRSYG